MPQITPEQAGGQNVCALLDMIAWSEGTDNNVQATKDRGYDVLVGGKLFEGYARHPNILVTLSPTLSSTAAGRYQILYRYWKVYQKELELPDFGPLSQDLYAINQVREHRALGLILAGQFQAAVGKLSTVWASLPGAPYGQRTHTMDECLGIYIMHGGTYS